MNSFWIIFLSSVLAVYASPTCDEEELKKCGLIMDNDHNFPRDAVELKKECNEEGPKFACIKEFVERCPTYGTKRVRDFHIAAGKLIHRICDGDLHSKYLRIAKCFGDEFTSKKTFCEIKLKDKMAEGFCVYQDAVEDCIGTFIQTTCGREAHQYFYEMYRVTRLTHEEECP